MYAGFSPRTNVRIGPIRNYFRPIRKKRADTHFFIPDTHNVIMMVWLRNIFHDAACMSRQNLDEKAVIVLHFFVSRTHVLCTTRCPHCPQYCMYSVQYTHVHVHTMLPSDRVCDDTHVVRQRKNTTQRISHDVITCTSPIDSATVR